MDDLLSIIIPAYNIESYIGRCLESLSVQTYKNLEIIVVDDGSTDNTLSIIKEYCNKDNRIKVIHKKNEGVSAQRRPSGERGNGLSQRADGIRGPVRGGKSARLSLSGEGFLCCARGHPGL